jgi:hypothetical protein
MFRSNNAGKSGLPSMKNSYSLGANSPMELLPHNISSKGRVCIKRANPPYYGRIKRANTFYLELDIQGRDGIKRPDRFLRQHPFLLTVLHI